MAQANDVTNAIPAPITGAIASNSLKTAHAELLASLASQPPPRIPLDTRPVGLENRAEHLNAVLKALSVYLTDVLDDTSENIRSGLDRQYIDALLSGLISEVTGTVQQAAQDMAGRSA